MGINRVYNAGCWCAGSAGCAGHDFDDSKNDLYGMNVEALLREIIRQLEILNEREKRRASELER